MSNELTTPLRGQYKRATYSVLSVSKQTSTDVTNDPQLVILRDDVHVNGQCAIVYNRGNKAWMAARDDMDALRKLIESDIDRLGLGEPSM